MEAGERRRMRATPNARERHTTKRGRTAIPERLKEAEGGGRRKERKGRERRKKVGVES